MSKTTKTDQAANRRKRVLLVDRHAFMRSAAADWINCCSALTVCGKAGGMTQAFRAVKQLRPDVVVSEIMRPRDLGFIRELHRRHPRLPILVFSIRDEAEFEARARDAGARSYLTKAAGGAELVLSICAVLNRLRARSGTSRLDNNLRPFSKSPKKRQRRTDCGIPEFTARFNPLFRRTRIISSPRSSRMTGVKRQHVLRQT